MILMQRLVKVDGKVRTDTTYPAGFMDVITLDKTDDHFRCGGFSIMGVLSTSGACVFDAGSVLMGVFQAVWGSRGRVSGAGQEGVSHRCEGVCQVERGEGVS
jgi:hypothetical protein